MTQEPGATPLQKPQWEKFAQLAAGGMTYEEAYQKAGFKKDHANAKRLSDKPEVRTRIDWMRTQAASKVVEATQEAISAAGLSREWVLTRLMENAERASQAVPVTIAGVPTGEYKYDGPVVNRALELLGKTVGLFSEATGQPGAAQEAVAAARSSADPRVAKDLEAVKNAGKLIQFPSKKEGKA